MVLLAGGCPIRMRSTGFLQGSGGVGVRVPLILKSPSTSNVAASEEWAVGGVVFVKLSGGPQKSVANTVSTASVVPIPSLAARTKPFPSAVILPFVLTLALNCLITQGWP